MKISVIGLGKLGACYAAFYANKKHEVVGVDTDAKKVRALSLGKPPVEEPELARYISKNKTRLSATMSVAEAVEGSSVTFIIVPTPSTKNGSFSTAYVEAACKEIGAALKTKKEYHLVCVVSTVLPGDSREKIIPAIEKASGKKCGEDFGYCYNPSLIAIGDILENLENPDFIFLGAFDQKSGDLLEKVYKTIYPSITPERMSVESVELAKIALNSYVTMKITFANMLGMLAEQIPNAHVDNITTALGKDKRIGSRYLRAGLGYGGPCFPRDNFAFAYMAQKRGIKTPIALATHTVNESIPNTIVKHIDTLAKKHKVKNVGFLGLSYKPKTAMTEESQAFVIAQKVGTLYRVSAYEPLGAHHIKEQAGKKIRAHETLGSLAKESDILFISNKDAAFSSLPSLLNKEKKLKIVVDPWGMFDPKEFKEHVIYKTLGRK